VLLNVGNHGWRWVGHAPNSSSAQPGAQLRQRVVGPEVMITGTISSRISSILFGGLICFNSSLSITHPPRFASTSNNSIYPLSKRESPNARNAPPPKNNRSRHSNSFPFHGGSSISHPFRHRPEPDASSYHCFGSAAGLSAFADDTTRTTVAASAFR
jgi:hypothetical protein